VSVTPLAPEEARPANFRIQADFLGYAADTRVILAAAQAIVALGVSGCDDQTSVTIEAIDGGEEGDAALWSDAALKIDAAGGSCSIVAEVQSVSDERAEAAVALVLDCLHDAANRPECTSDVDISVQRTSGSAR
jgi:tripeptide aminopeptidase